MKVLFWVLLGLGLLVAVFLVQPICACLNPAIPTVDLNTVSVHTVQYGTMLFHTRGWGAVSRVGPDPRATVQVLRPWVRFLKAGQPASVKIAGVGGSLAAKVVQIGKAGADGKASLMLSFTQLLPSEVRVGDSVDALIEYGRIENTLYMERGVFNAENADVQVFRLDPSKTATRVTVHFGVIASELIEIKSGLKEGDKVIVTDMSRYDYLDRLRVE
jgi:hypothetical protein